MHTYIIILTVAIHLTNCLDTAGMIQFVTIFACQHFVPCVATYVRIIIVKE